MTWCGWESIALGSPLVKGSVNVWLAGAGFWNFCASLRLWKRVLVFLTLALGAVVLANTGWDVLPGVCSTIVPILCCVGGWEAGCTLLEGRKDWVRLWQTTLPLDTNSSIFYRRVFWLPWRSTSDKLHIFIWCLSHFHHHLCARGERDWWTVRQRTLKYTISGCTWARNLSDHHDSE